MHIICCGISHRTALLEMREHFQLTPQELTEATSAYKALTGAVEAVLVVSCNRMEFYSVTDKKYDPRLKLVEFYRARGIGMPPEYAELFFVRHGASAARHLFKVACGLDSLVMGESQILGQVKDAYSAACACGGPGHLLHKLFHKAYYTAKKVRTETTISEGVTGLAGASVDVARKKLEVCNSCCNVLLIGVNSSTEIILSRLSRFADSFTVVNRTLSKAERLVRSYGGRAFNLDKLPELLAETDVLFSATSSRGYILTPDMLSSRSTRPLLAFDLAVPRDLHPGVASVPGVTLIDLDDLKHYLAMVSRQRASEVQYALQIVEEQVAEFEQWRLAASRTDSALRLLVEQDRQAFVEKFHASFAPKEHKALEAFSRQICRAVLRRCAAKPQLAANGNEEQ
ncbi:MAG: glutamyl-tRNA reductase [Calditrichaeota bacterium]|nr:glutamyl-tRNA reductase [Calditrichota bacterium]